MSKRKADITDKEMAAPKSSAHESAAFIISEDQPLKEYKNLMNKHVQVDEIVDDEVTRENFSKTAAAAHDVIWRLLFKEGSGKAEQQKAAELLEEYKGDACFYAPWPYNEWIVKLRDEVLKRDLLDFWRDAIVKNQLGPCWSRDSDLFDGDDAPPVEFYAKAGCVAPFSASLKVRAASAAESNDVEASPAETAAAEVDKEAVLSGNFEATISDEQPTKDYRNLMNRYVLVNYIVPDERTTANVNKIAKAARKYIWEQLFSDASKPDPSKLDNVAELLQEYKSDAGFYGPWDYNEWIVTLRDEVLKRDLLDFWRDVIVKNELGPCCSRDSDMFDGDDAPPLEFYAKAGCVAPFSASVTKSNDVEASAAEPAAADVDKEAVLSGNFEANISDEQPSKDYRNLMNRYVAVDYIVPDERKTANVNKIAKAVRKYIWEQLFRDASKPDQNKFDKVAKLLREYKSDAGFYGPWDYNEWIVTLRDEVLRRELLDFWREKMVPMQLGPCWYQDSDLLDSSDPIPTEFYHKAGCTAPFKVPDDLNND
ncbi:uncharacterized protein LOC115626346 [Scaptodrosophila lebanonensis]|uniref:Uncharacterized protein LOC115626346 n=1 Tax=Drosophila lebanonensis TaxID=7225 RepID=A0A6J2TPW8_DROLE|nr:uncharacterized protein LOC115626346 [Scaptodrosophila lebanonensis]